MKKKLPSQLEVIRSVRKPATRPTMIQRPERGGGYKRLQGRKDYEKDFDEE